MVHEGDVIAGKYRVERIVGQGAMGLVVAAMHVKLRERRAIKFMKLQGQRDPEAEERFLREARAASRLKSQHVVKVHDVDTLDTGEPYIVMEYLEGTDLSKLAKDRTPLPHAEAVSYILQASEAIGEAHAAGIVHRDLKPANLFRAAGVGGAPCVKVLDFGIAKLMASRGACGDAQMTIAGTVMGTPLYMSPEQFQSSRDVDHRSDIWSLGVILYKLVTGEHPFEAPRLDAISAMVTTHRPRHPSALRPDLPAGLSAVILRCLEKEPESRYQSIDELSRALYPFAPQGVQVSIPGAELSRIGAVLGGEARHLSPSATLTAHDRPGTPGRSPIGSTPDGRTWPVDAQGVDSESVATNVLREPAAPEVNRPQQAEPDRQTNAPWIHATGRGHGRGGKRGRWAAILVVIAGAASSAVMAVPWVQKRMESAPSTSLSTEAPVQVPSPSPPLAEDLTPSDPAPLHPAPPSTPGPDVSTPAVAPQRVTRPLERQARENDEVEKSSPKVAQPRPEEPARSDQSQSTGVSNEPETGAPPPPLPPSTQQPAAAVPPPSTGSTNSAPTNNPPNLGEQRK